MVDVIIKHFSHRFFSLFFAVFFACGFAVAMPGGSDSLRGTLVIGVPTAEGLVACSDKRLFNVDAGTFTDTSVKIRQVGNNALFAATNTVGFYDRQRKRMAFDAFEVTANYAAKHDIAAGGPFWDGLRKEIKDRLSEYFASRGFAEWPETDRANNNLLFNLVFYSVADGTARSHTLKVFYEKKRTPVVHIPAPVTEVVRTPKLSGKGRDVMAYLAGNPILASEPSILRFDESHFSVETTTVRDALDFSRKLFLITSTAVPRAQVSSTFDCALLSHLNGFQWIDPFGRVRAARDESKPFKTQNRH